MKNAIKAFREHACIDISLGYFFITLATLVFIFPACFTAQQAFTPGKYRMPEQSGVENAVLFYFNHPSIPDTVSLLDKLSPYVGYEKGGRYSDWYFDTFLPIVGFRYSNDKYPFQFTYDGWMLYTKMLFDKYYDVFADKRVASEKAFLTVLDQKVSEVGAALDDDTTKRNVIFIIPIPPPGKDAYPTVFQNTHLNISYDLKASSGISGLVKWYIDTMVVKWNELRPKRLRLSGFYWLREDIPDSSYLVDALKDISNYLHEKGLGFYVSPYLRTWTRTPTPSVPTSLEGVFDCAWLQPGFWTPGTYGAKSLADSVRLIDAADLAKQKNLGIDMEWHGGENSTYFRYLSFGYEAGYVYASHLFYESGGSVWSSANSSNPALRRQYDETHRFIKTSRKNQ